MSGPRVFYPSPISIHKLTAKHKRKEATRQKLATLIEKRKLAKELDWYSK